MKVRDILAEKPRELVTIRQDGTLLNAARRLREHKIGVLLVVDEADHPVGILSERDIVRRFAEQGGACEDEPIAGVMTEDPIIGLPDDDVGEVASVMTRAHIRHLPIAEGDKLIGLVSIRDVVEGQISSSEGEIRRLWAYMNSIP